MNIEGVVIFDAKSGIPLFSRLKGNIDSSLFSSFVTAIGHFSKELKFGGLSSFTTEEKVIYLAARDRIITALIAPVRKEFQEAYTLADNLGKQFETMSNGMTSLQPEDYSRFGPTADRFLREIKNPFLSRISGYVHEKYGGEISLKPKLMKESGAEGTMDMVVNLGIRYKAGSNGHSGRAAATAYSDSYVFCKVSEGLISKGEVMEFIDTIDGFGIRTMKKGNLEFIPYFPSRALIVGREYTPPVFEFLKKLPEDDEGYYIDGSHIYTQHKVKGADKNPKCYIDLLQWHDDGEPTEIEL